MTIAAVLVVICLVIAAYFFGYARGRRSLSWDLEESYLIGVRDGKGDTFLKGRLTPPEDREEAS